jgi:hypothetical protein
MSHVQAQLLHSAAQQQYCCNSPYAGFDLQWFSGYRTIRQFLKWNQQFDGSSPSRPRGNLTIYIAGAQVSTHLQQQAL